MAIESLDARLALLDEHMDALFASQERTGVRMAGLAAQLSAGAGRIDRWIDYLVEQKYLSFAPAWCRNWAHLLSPSRPARRSWARRSSPPVSAGCGW